MANRITGDFDAVLQVSGGTIDRLLASVHQNGFVKAELPSFPHRALLRIGDRRTVDGVKGAVRAQVGVPRVELLHGSTDRFRLEVGVTARYTPDPGTEPLPEFIHGTVRAEYRFARVDRDCRGWRGIADDFVWVRVVEGSVSFSGTAVDDADPFSIPVEVDEAEVRARITRQLEALLRDEFEAVPHRVGRSFRPGSLRSLAPPAGGSAVAVPVALSSPTSGGSIASLESTWLDRRDFGLAVSREYILSQVQPVLDGLADSFELRVRHRSVTNFDFLLFDVDVLTIDLDFLVRLDSARAEWVSTVLPGVGSVTVIHVTASSVKVGVVVSGGGRTYHHEVWFDLVWNLRPVFDASTDSISLVPLGPPDVTVHATGVFGGLIKSGVQPKIVGGVTGALEGVAFPSVGLGSGRQDLVDQLRTLDDQADAHLDEAVFGPDGVILRGTIPLASRRRPVHHVAKTSELDAFSAFESWFPAGRIDAFEWSWSWFNGFGERGKASRSDRFLLSRPRGSGAGEPAALAGRTPLPGLDGMGTMCLNLSGVQVDARTGELVPVHLGRRCRRYGFDVAIHVPEGVGRLYSRERFGPPRPDGPPTEAGLLEIGTEVPATRSNTLVLHPGVGLDLELVSGLGDGVAESRREGAGLLVLVLFAEGGMPAPDERAAVALRELTARFAAPVVVTEDVGGGWSHALGLEGRDGDAGWRLLSPGGGVTWMHDGRVEARALAAALSGALRPSPPPSARSWGLEVGERVSDLVLRAPPCPPVPLDRIGLTSRIAFVQRDSSSSRDRLARLDRSYREEAGHIFAAAVIDGADTEHAEALGRELGLELPLIGDPRGSKARRLGVRRWPTTVELGARGEILSVDDGAGADLPDAQAEEASAG